MLRADHPPTSNKHRGAQNQNARGGVARGFLYSPSLSLSLSHTLNALSGACCSPIPSHTLTVLSTRPRRAYINTVKHGAHGAHVRGVQDGLCEAHQKTRRRVSACHGGSVAERATRGGWVGGAGASPSYNKSERSERHFVSNTHTPWWGGRVGRDQPAGLIRQTRRVSACVGAGGRASPQDTPTPEVAVLGVFWGDQDNKSPRQRTPLWAGRAGTLFLCRLTKQRG